MFNQLKSIMLTGIIVVLVTFGSRSLWAQNMLTIQPVFKEAGIAAIYEINFTVSQAIPADAQFVIHFPTEFDLTKVNMAGSATINGGFITKVQGSDVTLTRSGLGDVVTAGQPVKLQFATVKNPDRSADYSVTVEIISGTNTRILEVENQVQIVSKEK